ncbi:hypothetical protein EJ04DRAFT_517736 [Polyplosphaeria fusca]|uniref:Uncharacterized protein n=1 Tax=Polyplosphaeria fusca TaxID=682080 RepID=A0A9P4QKJ3_9PLEO|nr:hypothetical protein EJ04DRAFT_517736 [Polyplosphaeria fusca]
MDWQEKYLLIIDEVSMLCAPTLYAARSVARTYPRNNPPSISSTTLSPPFERPDRCPPLVGPFDPLFFQSGSAALVSLSRGPIENPKMFRAHLLQLGNVA